MSVAVAAVIIRTDVKIMNNIVVTIRCPSYTLDPPPTSGVEVVGVYAETVQVIRRQSTAKLPPTHRPLLAVYFHVTVNGVAVDGQHTGVHVQQSLHHAPNLLPLPLLPTAFGWQRLSMLDC